MKWIHAVYGWTLAADWRTWVAHTALALVLGWLFGSWTAAAFYLFREVEQVALQGWTEGWPAVQAHAVDHFADAFIPLFVLAGAALAFGW